MQHLSIGDHERVMETEEISRQSPHEGLCLVCFTPVRTGTGQFVVLAVLILKIQGGRPERDAYGNDRFENFNFLLNDPPLAGIALAGEDIAGVADSHVVETHEFVRPSDIYNYSEEEGK